MAKKKTKRQKSQFTAKTADKHILYQLSVQDTEHELKFIDRVFRKLRGRKPATLREDFCGTALMCATWVRRPGRRAVGVDIDSDVLAWGVEHNLSPIGEPGDRVTLLEQDVRSPVKGKFDVALGLNFSYFIFKTRPELLKYFKGVRRSMGTDGIFIVDVYGGYEAVQPMEEPRRIKGGFTYVWDQDKVDPINNYVENHIHFRFRDGTEIKKAFSYDWRMWTLPELRELLIEAGFSRATTYWEDADADGEGTGVFRPKHSTDNEAAYVAYVIAER